MKYKIWDDFFFGADTKADKEQRNRCERECVRWTTNNWFSLEQKIPRRIWEMKLEVSRVVWRRYPYITLESHFTPYALQIQWQVLGIDMSSSCCQCLKVNLEGLIKEIWGQGHIFTIWGKDDMAWPKAGFVASYLPIQTWFEPLN